MQKLRVTALVPEKRDASGKVTQKQLGPATIEVPFGETATESIQMFGDEPVNSNAAANFVVKLQGNIRTGLKKGEVEAQLQARLGSVKMGVAIAKTAVDPEMAWLAKYQMSTPEERKKMKRELEKKAAALD